MDSNRSTPAYDTSRSPAPHDRERGSKDKGASKNISDILNTDREGSAPSTVGVQPNPLAGLSRSELNAMPIRTYLDISVLPVVLEGMKQLSRDRPQNPLEFLGHYLLDHSDSVDRSPGP